MPSHAPSPAQVWQDDHKRNLRDPNYLCLWEPIPPPGFVAAGMVATTGGGSLPPNDMVRAWMQGLGDTPASWGVAVQYEVVSRCRGASVM